MTEQLHAQVRRREELLSRYRSTKTTCPTCDQTLPKAKITELEGKIAAAQQLQRQQMTASENRVNQ